jgi:hypothetical protein
MRIIHLSTGHLGGAGLAARRLSAGLASSGIDSKFFALSNPSFQTVGSEFQIERGLPDLLRAGFSTFISQRLSDKSLVTPLSTNVIDRKFLLSFGNPAETIFHIHNWFNIFSHREIAALSNEFKIVLTLHDQRFFSGACHYSFDCKKFESVCTDCPQLPIPFKNLSSHIFEQGINLDNLTFISPSNWLYSLALRSTLLSRSKGSVIPNCFYQYESELHERVCTDSTINVGLAAMNPDSWIKGGELVSALQSRQSGGDQFKFFSLSNYSDYKEFWRKIDVLLVPSEADNSPNVIHESKLWGIPVVASNVGGIPELLISNFDGELLMDGLTLEKVVAELRTSNLLTRNYKTRQQVSKNHREFLNTSVNSHIDLYQSLLAY